MPYISTWTLNDSLLSMDSSNYSEFSFFARVEQNMITNWWSLHASQEFDINSYTFLHTIVSDREDDPERHEDWTSVSSGAQYAVAEAILEGEQWTGWRAVCLTVPEPGPAVLILTSLAGLVAYRRKTMA